MQREQRSRFAKAFFQPEVGMVWITHQLLWIVAEVGQRVAELVRKLKTVLGPVSIPSGKSDPNAAARRSLEIRLRMIGPVVNIDTVELSVGTIPPELAGR
jgi:hypothetical protein